MNDTGLMCSSSVLFFSVCPLLSTSLCVYLSGWMSVYVCVFMFMDTVTKVGHASRSRKSVEQQDHAGRLNNKVTQIGC